MGDLRNSFKGILINTVEDIDSLVLRSGPFYRTNKHKYKLIDKIKIIIHVVTVVV